MTGRKAIVEKIWRTTWMHNYAMELATAKLYYVPFKSMRPYRFKTTSFSNYAWQAYQTGD
jgi:hypothetical protein